MLVILDMDKCCHCCKLFVKCRRIHSLNVWISSLHAQYYRMVDILVLPFASIVFAILLRDPIIDNSMHWSHIEWMSKFENIWSKPIMLFNCAIVKPSGFQSNHWMKNDDKKKLIASACNVTLNVDILRRGVQCPKLDEMFVPLLVT